MQEVRAGDYSQSTNKTILHSALSTCFTTEIFSVYHVLPTAECVPATTLGSQMRPHVSFFFINNRLPQENILKC